MSPDKEIDYNQKILDMLKKYPYGLTISILSKKVGISRNTAYRYLGILEAKKQIFTKVIGNFILYYSKARSMHFLDNMIPVYKRLLYNLQKEFSEHEATFKRIGRDLSDYINIPQGTKFYEILESLHTSQDKKVLEIIVKLIRYFTLVDNNVNVKIIDIDKGYKKATYLLTNSVILTDDMNYNYHFNLLTGIIEEKLKKILNKEVKCELLECEILEKKEDSYIKISIEII